MTQIDYLDFHIRIGPRQGDGYPVLVNAPTGEAREIMVLLQADLVARIRSDLPWRADRPLAAGRALGTQMFDALFVGSLRTVLESSRLRAWKEDKGLRVRLNVRSPDLAAWPWELLYDPDRSEFLALSSWVSLVRFVELPDPVRPLHVTPPLRVLGLVVNPADTPRFDVEGERSNLEAATQALRDQGLLELTWLEGETWRDLQRALRGGPWHVLHFGGHGMFDDVRGEGALLLANEHGRAAFLRADELGRLLASHRSLRLVVLNAIDTAKNNEQDPFSGLAAAVVRRGIPAAVGMQREVSDQAFSVFTRSFYEPLADGYPVDAALAEARIAVSLGLPDSLEWSTPVLFLRTPDGVLFVGDRPVETPARPQPQAEPAAASPGLASINQSQATALSPALSQHLETQRAETLRRYEDLSKRIAALDTDLGREMDSERKLVLEERRAALAAQREQEAVDMARIDQQLASGSAVAAASVDPARAAPSSSAGLSAEERSSLQRQLAELRRNLLLIEERKSAYVQETDTPLQLVKEERRVRERIEEIDRSLGRT